jgi:hypothetical protein
VVVGNVVAEGTPVFAESALNTSKARTS